MKKLTAVFPVTLMAAVLAGCSTPIQKTDWPTCAAIGGAGGALLGSIESSGAAAGGGIAGAALAGAYCYYTGTADSDGDGVVDAVDQCPNTPVGTPVDETGCPILPKIEPQPVVEMPVPPKQEAIVIHDLPFALDSFSLSDNARSILDATVARLRSEDISARFMITGHTDSTGSDAYNQKLSERRAQSVADYLVQSGIAKESIQGVQGMGETQPIATNKTPEGRALNRRVQIDIQR